MTFSALRDYEVYELLRQGSLISFVINCHTHVIMHKICLCSVRSLAAAWTEVTHCSEALRDFPTKRRYPTQTAKNWLK